MARRHLYEIDLMRAFVMLGVLSVHTMTWYMGRMQSMPGTALALSALHTSMHFTRESFMFITGLVLFFTYYSSKFELLKFWKRRLSLIAIPYVAWNVLYILYEGRTHPSYIASVSAFARKLWSALLSGNEFYIYYVLVTLQFYLLFPLLLLGLRKLKRWHPHIFAGSFLVQMWMMYANKYILPHIPDSHMPALLELWVRNSGVVVLSYQFWFIAGAIIAIHYDAARDWVLRHARAMHIALAVGAVAVWSNFLFDRLVLHQSYGIAGLVLQPIMIPWSLLVTVNMWIAGFRWASGRERSGWRPFDRVVQVASRTSFGIYLVQPFPLGFAGGLIGALHVHSWTYLASIPFMILAVYFSGMAVAYAIGRIPLLSYIVGRKAVVPHPPKPLTRAA